MICFAIVFIPNFVTIRISPCIGGSESLNIFCHYFLVICKRTNQKKRMRWRIISSSTDNKNAIENVTWK